MLEPLGGTVGTYTVVCDDRPGHARVQGRCGEGEGGGNMKTINA